MDRKSVCLEQDERVLLRNVLLPKIVIKIEDVDTDNLNEHQIQIIECLHCQNLAIEPKSCLRCMQFVCKKCCENDSLRSA